MKSPIPKIKSSARISQLDDNLYSMSLPDADSECHFNDAGYLIIEEIEPGKYSLDDVIAQLKTKYGLVVKKSDLERLVQILAHLDLLEGEIESGSQDVNFEPNDEGVIEFFPETEYSAKQEIKDLLKKAALSKTLLYKLDKDTWLKILFGVILFVFPWPDRATGPAEILPYNDVDVRTSVSGQIQKIYVQEGEYVAERKLLAELEGYQPMIERKKEEINMIQAELDILSRGATREELNEIKKQLELSKQIERQGYEKYKQYKALFDKGLISRQEYEDASSSWKINVKEYESAKAKLNLIESGTRPEKIQAKQAEKNALIVDLQGLESMHELSKIYAPIAGVVATPDLNKFIGKFVSPGEIIMKISNNKRTIVLSEVSESELGKLDVGASLTFKIQALPNKTFRSKVTRISPIVEKSKFSDQRVVRVYADMDTPNKQILPGMTGTSSITVGWNSIGILLFYDSFLAIRMFLVI